MNVDLAAELRAKVPLFKDIPASATEELLRGSRSVTFEPNEAVVESGDPGAFLGVLLEGEAEVSFADDAGVRHRLALLKPGDVFGEMSLMTGERTAADVIGVERCRAVLIPQPLFSSVLATQPAAIRYLSRLISDRARQMGADEGASASAAAARKNVDPYGLSLRTDPPLKLLVVNCGSSSLKYALYDTGDESRTVQGLVERIGAEGTAHVCHMPGGREARRGLGLGGHAEALDAVLAALVSPECGALGDRAEIAAVGHRVVHGGEKFTEPTVVTPEVLAAIEALSELAPLHNPINAAGIRAAMRAMPDARHVAVFDTAFHHTLPSYAYLYGLPFEQYERRGVRRYGFHGTSHLYVSLKAAQYLKRPFRELEIISCHLGNGASICAIDHGRSVDTSMGMTPSEGLIMGTRCGDIDPGALTHLMRVDGLGEKELDELINRKGGLLGLSGISNDMREILKAADEGNHRAMLAYKTFCYRVRKYIGAYCAAMQGVDAVVFTGGIGQGSAGVRGQACQGLGYLGIAIDEAKNREAAAAAGVADISAADARVRTLVVPADEERMIARETLKALGTEIVARIIRSQKPLPIPLEISAHHVHLSQEHVELLFGAGHQLSPQAELSQPGQFACTEQVNLVGPKGRVDRVRVLGPARKATQIEIAMTEQFRLGIHPPIRESGDIDGTPGVTLEGPAGTAVLEKGVICALRHVHMSPADALKFGLKDRNMIRVRVDSGERELVFGDVLVRVHPSFRLALHLDTDEGNAASVRTGMMGYLDGIQTGA